LDIQQTITDWVSATLPNNGYILEIQIISQPPRHKVVVILDTDQGITIEECAVVSRQLAKNIEEKNLFGENPYTLEVSSPGVDYPLRQVRQFAKNINRKLQITLLDGAEKNGILQAVTDSYIEVKPEIQMIKGKKIKTEKGADLPFQIEYSQIKQAKVLVSF
jgi:ribosome maturation factor RimP